MTSFICTSAENLQPMGPIDKARYCRRYDLLSSHKTQTKKNPPRTASVGRTLK